MSKKNKKMKDVVYSTNPNFSFEYEDDQEEETLPNNKQHLKVTIDKKQRKGKEVVLVTGFIGSEDDLNTLGKILKQKCGVGGATKDGEIIIQGNQIQKIMDYLNDEGYNVKRIGG